MSYQALARKWRPKSFADLVGQGHVVKALGNALARNRLHHAYLLTGTRGVGKTTIARIFAKSLNCETGVSAQPCGACRTCTEIDGGRFVDLLELDAASNTGVDNMREILDNARYAPTAGRYKVYLIDEVHMLSRGAFNSMLKTLEEPPEHVKFVLATTDPQKIPVTVLSRCLQFNLKPLSRSEIAARLDHILAAEDIEHDEESLSLLAAAAAGSLRDALSLLDQAIVHGAGSVQGAAVRAMLGVVDREYLWRLAESVAAGDGRTVLAEVATMAERGLSFDSALQELAGLLHRVAVAQVLPDVVDRSDPDAERLLSLARAMAPEAVQLFYQIALQGRADLPLAPDEQTGFQMSLLRMLAFEQGEAPGGRGSTASRVPAPQRAVSTPDAAPTAAARGDRARRADGIERSDRAGVMDRIEPTGGAGGIESKQPGDSAQRAGGAESKDDEHDRAPPVAVVPLPDARPAPESTAPREPIDDWPAFVAGLGLTGMALQLAGQSELRGRSAGEIVLGIPESARHLGERAYVERLRAAVVQALGRPVRLRVEVSDAVSASLAEQSRRAREHAQQQAEEAFRDDPVVQDLLAQFGARIRPDSIKPS